MLFVFTIGPLIRRLLKRFNLMDSHSSNIEMTRQWTIITDNGQDNKAFVPDYSRGLSIRANSGDGEKSFVPVYSRVLSIP